jgi:hypothetical protein
MQSVFPVEVSCQVHWPGGVMVGGGDAGDAVEVMMSEEGLAGAWFSGR